MISTAVLGAGFSNGSLITNYFGQIGVLRVRTKSILLINVRKPNANTVSVGLTGQNLETRGNEAFSGLIDGLLQLQDVVNESSHLPNKGKSV